MATPTATAVFERDGDLFVPTELARGPWDPNACHGGPSAALLASALDGLPSEAPVVLARLTVELLRPVPMTPLRLEVRPAATGRKVQRIEASVFAGEREVANTRRPLLDGVAVLREVAPPALAAQTGATGAAAAPPAQSAARAVAAGFYPAGGCLARQTARV